MKLTVCGPRCLIQRDRIPWQHLRKGKTVGVSEFSRYSRLDVPVFLCFVENCNCSCLIWYFPISIGNQTFTQCCLFHKVRSISQSWLVFLNSGEVLDGNHVFLPSFLSKLKFVSVSFFAEILLNWWSHLLLQHSLGLSSEEKTSLHWVVRGVRFSKSKAGGLLLPRLKN